MEQNSISRLLRKVRTIQFISFFTQCFLILVSISLAWLLARLIADQYAWRTPFLPMIVFGTLSLFVLIRLIAIFAATDDRTNAAQIDLLYGLKERVTTYVELRKNGHPFLEPLIQESSAKIGSVSPWKASRLLSGFALPLTLLVLFVSFLLLVPYLPVPKAILAKKEERKTIVAKAKDLQETVRRLQKIQTSREMKKILQEFQRVAQELQKNDTDKSKALKQLNSLEEKLRKLDTQNQQRLAKELQNAWNQAKQPDAKNDSLTESQKAEIDQLAKAFDRAMEGKESAGGHQKENLRMEQFSTKDLQAMKEALKKFEVQKAQSDQMRSQLQEALENAQNGTAASSKKKRYITDSRLKDREVETGKGGVEDGPGTTNKDSGPAHFDTRKKGKEEYVEDRTKSEYEKLYEGQRENAGKDPLYLQNQWNENGDPGYTHVRNFGINKDPSLNSTPQELTGQNEQESPVRKERVPPSYQKIVKKYFESINEQR